MSFLDLAKHGLNKHGFKDQRLVSFGGGANREERKREKKRRGRGRREEEEEKRKKEESKIKKVWNYMGF